MKKEGGKVEAAELESRRTRKHAGCSAWLLPLCLQGEQLRRERRRREEGGGPGEVVGELRMKTERKEGKRGRDAGMEVWVVGSRRKPSSSVMEWMSKLWSGLLRVKPECRERRMTKMDKDSRGERSALMGKLKWNKQKKTMLSGQKTGTQEAPQPTAGSRANDTTKQEGQ